MLKTISKLLVASALVLPVAAHATIFQFNASLSGAFEVFPAAPGGPGSGIATLHYNDAGTVATFDDTYNFVVSVFGLGLSPVSGYHIHGPATTAQNAGVVVNLQTNPSFTTAVNAGGTLVVFGNNVAPSATLLGTLLGGLNYINVHTTANPSGAIRGQLLQVAVVPEPETYGMLLAGLALIGTVVGRRKSKT